MKAAIISFAVVLILLNLYFAESKPVPDTVDDVKVFVNDLGKSIGKASKRFSGFVKEET